MRARWRQSVWRIALPVRFAIAGIHFHLGEGECDGLRRTIAAAAHVDAHDHHIVQYVVQIGRLAAPGLAHRQQDFGVMVSMLRRIHERGARGIDIFGDRQPVSGMTGASPHSRLASAWN